MKKIILLILFFHFVAVLTESCNYKREKFSSHGKLINGKKEGLWKMYDKNGVLREYNHYKNDSLNGDQITFDENGKLFTKAHYKMGIFVDSFFLYHDNGQIRVESWFDSSGKAQGVCKIYHKNGQLSEISHSIDGEPVDTTKGYNEEGRLIYYVYYNHKENEKVVVYLDKKGYPKKKEYYNKDSLYNETWLNSR